MTIWIRRHQFAPNDGRPGRERRLTWDRRDPQWQMFASQTGDAKSPVEEAFDLDPSTRGRVEDPAALMNIVESLKDTEDITDDLRQKMLRTVLAQRRPGAKKLHELIVRKAGIAAVRRHLETVFLPEEEKPAEAAQPQEEKKTEVEHRKKPTWLEKVIEYGSREAAKQIDPRIRRFERLRRNPVVQLAVDADILMDALEDPVKLPGVLQKIALEAQWRTLAMEHPNQREERLAALDDLFSLLLHSRGIIPPDRQAETQELIARVGACYGSFRAYCKRMEGEAEKPAEGVGTAQRNFEKTERIFEKLREKGGRKHRGERERDPDILLQCLRSVSDGADAFAAIGQAWKPNGWIDQLSPSPQVKYTCTLIALEELALLYHEIAQRRRKPETTETIIARVKTAVSDTVSGRVSGKRGNETIPFAKALLDPAKECTELYKHILRKPSPTNADIRELDLLRAWIRGRGNEPPVRAEEIEALRQRVEATREELQEDMEWASENLQAAMPEQFQTARSAVIDYLIHHGGVFVLWTSLKAQKLEEEYEAYVNRIVEEGGIRNRAGVKNSPHTMGNFIEEELPGDRRQMVIADLLRRSGNEGLLAALAGIREERTSAEAARELRAALTVKEERRLFRDPEFLRKLFDDEFQKKRRAVLDRTDLTEEEKTKEIERLAREYDAFIRVRQKLHIANLATCETHLTAALEAGIRLRAAEIEAAYEGKYVRPRFGKRLEALKGEHGSNIGEALYGDLIGRPEASNIDNLRKMKTATIRDAADPFSKAETFLRDLRSIGRELRNPEEEAAEVENNRKAAQAHAQSLLENKDIAAQFSEETREMLEWQARKDADAGSDAQRGLRIFAKDPHLLLLAQREYELIQAIHTTEREVQRKRTQVFASLKHSLTPYGADEDGFGILVQEQMRAEEMRVTEWLSFAQGNAPDAGWWLKVAYWWLTKLEQSAAILEGAAREPLVLHGEDFKAFARKKRIPEYASGMFDRSENRIVLNGDKCDYYVGLKEAVLTEERRHALNRAASELYSVFFLETFRAVAQQAPPDIRREFLALGERWVPREEGMTDEEWQAEVADELKAKEAVFLRYRSELDDLENIPPHIPLKPREVRFFRRLTGWGGHKAVPLKAGVERNLLFRPAAAANGVVGEGEEEELSEAEERRRERRKQKELAERAKLDFEEEPGVPPRNGFVEGSTATRDIADIEKLFKKIQGFLKTYADQATEENVSFIRELEGEFQRERDAFRKRENAEKEEQQTGALRKIREKLDAISREIDGFDAQERDLREEPPSARGLKALWNSIEWMSVSDFIAIYKAIKEDFTRQFNRRQQGKIGRVGESITGWIPKKIPYVGTLASEFHRRHQASEVEEVNKWKEAFTNIDSYTLQERLHHPANKDEMKAILILLSERGRIDWTDEDFWRALNKLSIFEMPIKECERNENLREEWLRKLITDIWNDKDNFRNWKSANSSNIESEKKKFNAEADRLGNLGELAGELKKQLKIFTEVRRHPGTPIPDDIQPHLYEEIIDYAIRMGRMTMEQKFYYLVRGVASGIMNADRLRVLAGEGGEIVMIFPFIDYFYQKNNTLPEIQALAARLTETEDGKDTFEPGKKTTMWLELEVAREESVQQRLRKAMDRRGADIDHDDMHFFIPRLDWKSIDSLATPQGGGRQKATTDGWRNAYTGYNSFFKSFGMLTRLEEEGLGEKFTSQDAYQIVKAVAGFVRLDGIMTKRHNFGDTEGRRPSIPWGEMKNSRSVVSFGAGNGTTVYNERERLDRFVRDFLRAYGFKEQNIEDMLYSTERNPNPDNDTQNRAKALSDALETRLLQVIEKKGTRPMKEALKAHMDNFVSHAGEGYNYETVKNLVRGELGHRRRNAAE